MTDLDRRGLRSLQMKNIFDFAGEFFKRPILFIDYTRADIESAPTGKECIRSVGEGFSLPSQKTRTTNGRPYGQIMCNNCRGRPSGRPVPTQMLIYIHLGQSRTPVPTTSYIIYDLVGEGLAPPDFYAKVTL